MHSLLEGTFLALPFYVLCGLGVVTFVAFKRKTAPRLRRWRYALAAASVATFLIGAPAFGNALTLRIERRYPPRMVTAADRHPDNLIVVLTGGWFRWVDGRVDVKISEDGWERLDAGVKLWRDVGGTMLIAGAPARDGSGLSVAAAMADAAEARGVPREAIVVEPRSRNTYENLSFSLPLLQAHRDRVWLVTSALHLPRAMSVARKLGVAPIPYPCFYRASRGVTVVGWLPNNEGPVVLEQALHEEIGVVWYWLRGWL